MNNGTFPKAGVQEDPALGVVVVNYNSGVLLQRCLRAVAAQTVTPKSVAVVDNSSQDGSAEALEEIWPGIIILRNEQNLGFAAAANQGMELLCDCNWVAVLNPDAFPRPGWLAALARAMSTHPECGSFASRMLVAGDEQRIDGAGDVYHFSGLAWRRLHGLPVSSGAFKSEMVFGACAGAALYHRDSVLALGGFDAQYFCYFEDVDLGFRLQLSGRPCLYVADAEVEHVGSATVGKGSDFQIYHGHRNMVWTYFKNMPMPLLLSCLPVHLLANLATVLIYVARGKSGPVLRAKRDAFTGLPSMLRKRRCVQRNVGSGRVWSLIDKRLLGSRFA